MDYQQIKKQSLSFVSTHPAYFWSVLEFAMLFAAGYSIFGLVTMVTGAIATGNSVLMLLEFMAAPVYTVMLFAFVTLSLTVILSLPYAVVTGSLQPTAAPSSRRKTRATKSRKAA
jgi:hypothetical protein